MVLKFIGRFADYYKNFLEEGVTIKGAVTKVFQSKSFIPLAPGYLQQMIKTSRIFVCIQHNICTPEIRKSQIITDIIGRSFNIFRYDFINEGKQFRHSITKPCYNYEFDKMMACFLLLRIFFRSSSILSPNLSIAYLENLSRARSQKTSIYFTFTH